MVARQKLFSFFFLSLFIFDVAATVHYVDVNSATPMAPYTSWTIAASVIQDAVAAAQDGDLVLVTNGLYDIGGTPYISPVTNRVLLISHVTLQSASGPQLTAIRGRAA